MQVNGVSSTTDNWAGDVIVCRSQPGSAGRVWSFAQVRGSTGAIGGVVASGHVDDSSDAIRRLQIDIMLLIGVHPR